MLQQREVIDFVDSRNTTLFFFRVLISARPSDESGDKERTKVGPQKKKLRKKRESCRNHLFVSQFLTLPARESPPAHRTDTTNQAGMLR